MQKDIPLETGVGVGTNFTICFLYITDPNLFVQLGWFRVLSKQKIHTEEYLNLNDPFLLYNMANPSADFKSTT